MRARAGQVQLTPSERQEEGKGVCSAVHVRYGGASWARELRKGLRGEPHHVVEVHAPLEDVLVDGDDHREPPAKPREPVAMTMRPWAGVEAVCSVASLRVPVRN